MLREKGATRFPPDQLGRRLSSASPNAFAQPIQSDFAFFLTSRGMTNEVYYMAQKAARFLGTNNVDNAARLCHAPTPPR